MDDSITSATYSQLFPEQVANRCSPGALESNTGPLAYLHALYQQALALEAKGAPDSQIKLAVRRPDIGELVLDQSSLDNQIPALTLVVEAMTRQANLFLGQKTDLLQEIAKAQYPVQLPFHYPLEQINAVLRDKNSSLFEVLQKSISNFPNFTYGNLRTNELRQVMRTATGLSPALQSLLLDKGDATAAGFLQTRYGVTTSADDALEQLTSVEFLCQKTGLKPEAVLDLLATSGVPDDGREAITTVKQSSAYAPAGKDDPGPIAGHIYGAAFINNATAPALSLEDTQSGPGISLRIKGATADHFGRIHKIIHLQHALQLPFADVDLLVMTALHAEGQTKDFHITENTLRTLGVFLHMRSEYGVTAEQFAALIGGMTPYATGDTVPFLDRVLDGPGPGQLPDTGDRLLLDASEFDISTDVNSDGQTSIQSPIGGICRAFALEQRLANAYLSQVTQALKLQKPALSLPVFSSLYRLTRLPRLLQLGMSEGASLIALLAHTDPNVLTQLAGTPEIIEGDRFYDEDDLHVEQVVPDILDILTGVINLETWLRRQKISAQALLSWLTPLPSVIPDELRLLYSVDAHIKQTLLDGLPRIRASLLNEGKIAQQVGSNVKPASGSWLNVLLEFLDARGLVKSMILPPPQRLKDKLAETLNGKLVSANAASPVDINEVADQLDELITNAAVAQEDLTRNLISTAFTRSGDGFALTTGHVLPLLRWINESRFNLLADVLAATDTPTGDTGAPLEGLTLELWYELARHAQAIKHLRLSAAGLTALLDHPRWFDRTGKEDGRDASATPTAAVLSLDLCYQISSYRDWIEKCQQNGFEEADIHDYFVKYPASDQSGAATAAGKRLSDLIGWNEQDIAWAMPHTVIKETVPDTTAPKTLDDYLKTLNSSELGYYNYCDKHSPLSGLGILLFKYNRNGKPYDDANAIYKKFQQFLTDNPGSLKVTRAQSTPDTLPDAWKSINNVKSSNPITLEIYSPQERATTVRYHSICCVCATISDIDYIMRLQSLCETTGLSCQSLLELSRLDEQSPYENFNTLAKLLLGVCNDDALNRTVPALQEGWRDALAAYLLGYWAPSSTALQQAKSGVDDLSSYFLTDILVSSEVSTNRALQTTASLQHYLHRLFARLDPGYTNTIITQEESSFWRRCLSEYGTWKIWRTQLNHPENLIYYANRPNKSAAFQSLETELNQGKLDTALLQTAITSYLTKFEQTSNLQVISGYLDGVDPKNDTYHFIGRTNASPAEYYWRSVDMGLRDNKERLSPLAWTEWEKIAFSVSGQIVQSRYTDPDTRLQYQCDAIRPVIIEGRPYVFWVERGSVGLPSSDEKNQTPTKFKKISVQYIYKQSDGFWAPPNELICLDGTRDGKRLPDKDNPYLKDDTYEPGLIALVDIEADRAQDPWLTVMLYNCAYEPATSKGDQSKEESASYGNINNDYFIEARDLLLIDRKQFPSDDDTKKFSKIVYNSYGDLRKIQHPYTGSAIEIKETACFTGTAHYALENYKPNTLTTPNYNRETTRVIEQISGYHKLYEDSLTLFDTIDKNLPLIKQLPFLIHNRYTYPSMEQQKLISTISEEITKSKTTSTISWQEYGAHTDPNNGKPALHFSLGLPSSSLIVSYTSDKPTSLRVAAYYKKIIIDTTITPTLISVNLNKTVTVEGFNYTFTLQATDVLLSVDQPQTFTIQITGQGTKTPRIGFLISAGDEYHQQAAKIATALSGKPGQWTCDLVIDFSVLLLEPGFTIQLYVGEKLIASANPEVVINPKACKSIELRLYAKGPGDASFSRLTEERVVADGQAVITQDYAGAGPVTNPGEYMFALCEAGDPLQNIVTVFDVRALGLDENWDVSIKRNDQQAQYLDLSTVTGQTQTFPPSAIRLNTLFGKQLVSRAARSVDHALEWEAQLIQEPTIDPTIPTPPVDFHGANGAHFRELFLHLPDLVATRLSEQQQFDEAERWYTQYLFDPYRTQTDEKNRPPLWNTRPLAEVGAGSSELQKPVDPTARAFTLSRHYRQAVLLALLDNWQRQGDYFYRQLTPSSLNHAWLCYQKALKLIGPLPERTAMSRWVPMALNSVDSLRFRIPINERVTSARKYLEHRLFNLRHGLTLDGKILPALDWREEGADPFGFGQRGIGHLASSYNSDRAQIPAYRFRQLIPMARAAVQQLQDMGRHYMKLMEDEFNTTLSVLLKQQEIRISDFTLRLQQETINAVKAKKNTLLLGRQATVSRRDYYTNLIQIGRSRMEEDATALLWTAAYLKGAVAPFSVGKGIADSVPCIFGMAVGGQENAAGLTAAIAVLDGVSAISKFTSEHLLLESGYERRADEWKFELKQAELDIQSIDLQIKEANIELNAATINHNMARAERLNLEEAHVAMTTGFTIIPIYNWLVARQELLYGPAYDAVLSLCLSTEAAWRYEIGDYKRPAFIKTSAWVDSYKGMLAGESLLVDLQEMENAHIQCNERRLSIKKTVGVRGAQADADWVATLKGLTSKPLVFEFKSVDFDKNYPGHYLRQLRHVSVSFVMTSDAGPRLENVSAILTQTDSTILVEPTSEGADYLYAPGTKAPDSIKRNLRAQQQIALSSAQADDGLGVDKVDWVYELMFNDGRFLPFEGTGAISRWQLTFPDVDFVNGLLAADGKTSLVKNIQIHLTYTALDGGKAFTDKLKTLMQASK